MPGPKKPQAQRVKGNLKPSSSSQAAQLLAASGQAPVGFIGFSTQPAFVPASETFDDVDNSLDADFRLVLRKLSKKDTVTKIKALQELVSLCVDKSNDDVKAIVPFWPRIYNKVALDVDHKVRELSQKAMMTMANRAGKSMAPHLKTVMGSWMVSMCDTYPTVATAANSAFTGTFPPAKQSDAVRFCKADIADCLLTNILKHSAQTLSDPTTTSEEDMITKYNRVVSSSLQAFRKLCNMLPSESVSSSMSTYFNSLLGNPAFWKHTKSSVSVVKGGLLSLLSSICQLCPEVSSQFVKKISPFVFSCIDTSDPVIVSYAWEALLSLINAHEECWEHVNWQKAVWPKLKSVLESGCFGHAVIVSPCFLPLLSKIPHQNHTHIFDAMRTGLTKESLVNSVSDMSAFVQAFMECIQYSVKHVINSDSPKISNLLQDQILVIIEAALTEEKASLSKSPLFALLAPLMNVAGSTHPEIEELFWKDLSDFIVAQLLASQHNVTSNRDMDKYAQCQKTILQRTVILVQGLVFHEVGSSAKKPPVRFSQPTATEPSQEFIVKKKQPMSQAVENLISDLLVTSFCMVEEHAAAQFLSLFKDIAATHIPASSGVRLISDSDPVKCKLSEDLQQKTKITKRDPEIEAKLSEFLDKTLEKLENETKHHQVFLYSHLLRLLMCHQKEESLNLKYTEELLMCMFSFLAYLPEEDGSMFLSAAQQVLTTPLIICQFIEQFLHQVNQIPACRKNMQSLGISAKIAGLATQVTDKLGQTENTAEMRSKAQPVWKMLSGVMSYFNEEEDDPFSSPCVDAVMNCCISSLKWLKQNLSTKGSESVPALIGLVQSTLERRNVVFHIAFPELLLSILSLVLSSNLCSDNEGELEDLWVLCLKSVMSDSSSASHMESVCNFIREWVCSHLQTAEDLNRVSQVVQLMASNEEVREKDSDGSQTEFLPEKEKVEDVSKNQSEVRHVLDVIVSEPLSVEGMEEIMKYLYIEDVLPSPTSCVDTSYTGHVLSMKSYTLIAVHNLRSLSIGRKPSEGQDRNAHQMSHRDLECLTRLAESVLVIFVADKTHYRALNDIRPVVTELKRGVKDFFASLTYQQIMSLIDIALNRSPSLLASVGVEKLLLSLLQSDVEMHSKKATSVGRRILKLSFLHKYITPSSSAEEVANLLKDTTVITGSNLSEAFTLTCSLIMSLDTTDLGQITGCFSGFLSMLIEMPDLPYELKLVFFNQIHGIVKHLQDKGIHLLTGSDIDQASNESQVHFNVCVARMLNAVVLPQSHDYWEFALCSLVEWLQFVTEVNVTEKSDKSLQALVAAVCQLAHSSAKTFSQATVIEEITADSPSLTVTEKMKTEWDEFFSDGIFSSLLPLYVSLSSQCLTRTIHFSPSWTLVLKPLASAASLCPASLVSEHQLPARLTLTDSSALPDNLKTLLNHLCPLLNAKERHIGVAAFNILNCVIDKIPEHEIKAKDEGEEEEARAPPEAIMLVVESNAVYLDCLMTVDIEAEVEIEQESDEYAHAMGYLLAWRLLLQLFRCSSNELRAKYAQFFKKQESVSHLLDHLFRLMPSNPSSSLLEFKMSLDAADGSKHEELFTTALNVYRQCLEVIPALVRTWWVDQNRKNSNFVDRFTTDYMSNSLCWQQLTSPQMTSSNIEDITIRARPAAREVIAVYQMAEVTINMTITLPENFPLGKVDVVCDKRVGVSQSQWDRWLLQLNIFLQHQNGSIVEGLKLWKRNIDKKFEGIDDCMICFSIIHGTTFQLPRLTCRTCRKKFHSSCLYKWFHTSQKSSCPLCRNLF